MGVGFLVMIISVLGKGCASASGTFEASGANPLGTALFNPTECASGQAQGFFGVSLLQDSPSAGSIVVIKDVVRGRLVQVNIPGHCAPPNVGQCRPVELSADMCRLFDVRIESTNLQVNDIRALEGHLNLDCPFPDGGLIKSDITFTGCH